MTRESVSLLLRLTESQARKLNNCGPGNLEINVPVHTVFAADITWFFCSRNYIRARYVVDGHECYGLLTASTRFSRDKSSDDVTEFRLAFETKSIRKIIANGIQFQSDMRLAVSATSFDDVVVRFGEVERYTVEGLPVCYGQNEQNAISILLRGRTMQCGVCGVASASDLYAPHFQYRGPGAERDADSFDYFECVEHRMEVF